MSELERKLVEMLEAEGLQVDGYGFGGGEVEYVLDYHNDLGKKGLITIYLNDDNDYYLVSTSNEHSGQTEKNQRKIKTVKAVKNYIYKFIEG